MIPQNLVPGYIWTPRSSSVLQLFSILLLPLLELFCDVGTKGGFFVVWNWYQSNCSHFHLSPLKVSFVHQTTLCQCVNIISDIDTDQGVREVIGFSQLCVSIFPRVMMCYCLGGNTGNHFPAVSFHFYYYFNCAFSGWNNLANGLLGNGIGIYLYPVVGNIRPE